MALLPKAPLQLVLRHLGKQVASRHPEIFTRLGPHAEKRFLVVPTDLPFAFMLHPARPGRMIDVVDPLAAVAWDCRIAGSFAALLGLMHGLYDGDGLFFSRDLAVEGDVESVLALRNALDDADLDLFAELMGALGSPGRIAAPALRVPVKALARATGVALLRGEEFQ